MTSGIAPAYGLVARAFAREGAPPIWVSRGFPQFEDKVSKRPRIYLDHAATTPILPAAKAAMVEAMERWANPSSPHTEGRAARAALEDARERIKRALGWDGGVIFTSGATEAIQIALAGRNEYEVRYSAVEHDAVVRAGSFFFPPLAVTDDGLLDLDDLRPLTDESDPTTLIVVQHANNETGVLQPILQIQSQVGEPFGRTIAYLCDCAQTAGKIALPAADLVAISSHKLGGPPGVGALLVRDFALLTPAGGQEKGYRGGTENLPAILGFAAALEAAPDWMEQATRLRARLEDRLSTAGAEIVARDASRVPTIGAYRMRGVPSEAQLIHFDLAGIAVSAGSACSSGSMKPSRVLAAMGWEEQAAREVIRVSFGPQTTEQDIDSFANVWEELAERRRAA
jgi:cysteine desulfurase